MNVKIHEKEVISYFMRTVIPTMHTECENLLLSHLL
jgi:hypothetical protein